MQVRWITQKEANRFVIGNHRHHGKVVGSIFQLGLFDAENLIAVAIVGRPVARRIDYRKTVEITRLCSDGTENACSKLYGACCRIAREMGFEKIITYILASESGASLRAAGFIIEEDLVGGVDWNVPSRPREIVKTDLFGTVVKYPSGKKKRAFRILKV